MDYDSDEDTSVTFRPPTETGRRARKTHAFTSESEYESGRPTVTTNRSKRLECGSDSCPSTPTTSSCSDDCGGDNNKLWIWVLILVVILIIVGGGFAFYNNKCCKRRSC